MLSCGNFYMGLDKCVLQGSQLETELILILWVLIAQLKSSVWTTATCFSCTVHPPPCPSPQKNKQTNKNPATQPEHNNKTSIPLTVSRVHSPVPASLGCLFQSPFQVIMGSQEENAFETLGGLAPGKKVRIEREDCCLPKTLVSL